MTILSREERDSWRILHPGDMFVRLLDTADHWQDRAEKAEAEHDAWGVAYEAQAKEIERLKAVLKKIPTLGHDDECLFCGFKDRLCLETLGKSVAEFLAAQAAKENQNA